MDRKNDIKVDSFIHLGNYYSLDRVTHGSENYNMGYCLVEYNNELYLADTLEEEIHTDEGSNFNLSGMGKHDYVGDITEEIQIKILLRMQRLPPSGRQAESSGTGGWRSAPCM